MTKNRAGASKVSDHTIDPATGESVALRETGIAPDAVGIAGPGNLPGVQSKYQVHQAFAIPARLDTGKPDYFTVQNQNEIESAVPADRIARYLALGYISETNPTPAAE